MNDNFSEWLKGKYPEDTTQSSRLANVRRVEECYGSLDAHYRAGTYGEVLDTLIYSSHDARTNKPNPSRIPIKGDIRNNLATYKGAANLYLSFLKETAPAGDAFADDASALPLKNEISDSAQDAIKQKLSLEQDMQKALRQNIDSLGEGLRIIDGGGERIVDSGKIDITCEDDTSIVAIEMKAGTADSRSIAQILGYMGDLQEEEGDTPVRGILIAHDFDKRTKSAARVVSNLTLKRYSIAFTFENEE